MPLDVARLRLLSAKYRIDQMIASNIQQWAEEEILQVAQKICWRNGLSENAISGLYIDARYEGRKVVVDLRWDLEGPNGEPVWKFLDKGTPPHVIEAKGKLFGGSDWLRWYDKQMKPVFRKKVNHPGTKAMDISGQTRKEGVPNLKKRIIREVNKIIDETRIGR